MTTNELVAELKSRGVSDAFAESFRDVRLQTDKPGGHFGIPALVDGETNSYIKVNGEFTGSEADFVPLWTGVSKVTW